MSHLPLAIATIGHTLGRPIGSRAASLQMNIGTTMAFDHIPLSQRPADDLLAKAAELRQMASTARTEEVMNALLVLADRYAALAERRRTGDA